VDVVIILLAPPLKQILLLCILFYSLYISICLFMKNLDTVYDLILIYLKKALES
jgi:hypothetical protein